MLENKIKVYKEWLNFLLKVGTEMRGLGFEEVRTPTLVCSSAMEETLFGFKIEGSPNVFLPTSPEFSLKKLWLSGAFPQIFEISQSFRDKEEDSPLHESEFTMLEFYEDGVVKEAFFKKIKTLLEGVLEIKEIHFNRIKMNELFEALLGFQINPTSDEDFLREVLKFHGKYYGPDYTWNDLYQILYIDLLEPALNSQGVVLLENFPPQLAALSKINSDGWADRFEFMIEGVEVGNGYNELLDSDEHLKRWAKQHPVDQGLIDALEKTNIQSGYGIALGLERLFYIKNNRQQESVKVWPF